MRNLKKSILKLAAALFVAVMICSIAPAQEAEAATKIVMITADGVNMRRVPNAAGAYITVLSQGSKATFVSWAGDAAGNTWIKVNYNGTIGYIMYKASWETIAYSNSTDGSTESFTTLAKNTYIATCQINGLRVHSNSSTSANTIGYLYSGQQAAAVRISASWIQIQFYDSNGTYRTGYIWRSYAKLTRRSTVSGETFTATTGTVKINVNGLYVHKTASLSTTNRFTTTAKLNSVFTVTGVSDSWYRINFYGYRGYVVKSYVTYYTKKATTTVKLNNTNIGLVLDDDEDDGTATVKVLKWSTTKKNLKIRQWKWTSSDSSVVRVKKKSATYKATVTAQNEGTATVYFKYKVTGSTKWYKVACNITVTEDANYD